HPQKTGMTDPLFQRTADGQVYYYQNDHLGTPQRLIKSNGAIVWRATYTAFGEASVDADSTVENNLRFPGQYYDQETGLHQNYFRDYDPETGRYIQADPIGLEGGVNYFIYASSNAIVVKYQYGLKKTSSTVHFLPAGGNVENFGGPNTAATIVCDGKGNIVPYVMPKMYEEFNTCITDCMKEHEQVHVNQANVDSPGICSKYAKNTVVTFSLMVSPSQANAYELEAYRAERDCLLRKRNQECQDDKCKDEIDDRLHNTVYRNIEQRGGGEAPPRRPSRIVPVKPKLPAIDFN